MRKLVILITVLTIGLFLVSCGGSTTTAPTPPAAIPSTPQTVPSAPPTTVDVTVTATPIDAKALYASNCAACHGQNRQGVPNLAPALNATTLAGDSDADIKTTILKGKAGTAMAGFEGRLSLAEIDALAQFIKNSAP